MNKITVFTTGFFVSVASSIALIVIYGKHAEPWDHETLSYLYIFFPTLVAFGIALRTRFVFALLFLAGLFAGNILHIAFFANTDQRAMWETGAMMYMLMLTYPLIGAVSGWLLHIVWLRFFDTHAKHVSNVLTDRIDSFLQKPPKWAYRPFLFTQSAKSGALKQLLIALLFGIFGMLLIIYPSPPLNPLPTFVHKWVTIGGYLQLGGFFWFGYKAMKLFVGKGAWHISLDNEKLLYHTPAGSVDPSFECCLDEIDKVEVIRTESNDSETATLPLFYLYTKSGTRYEFGHNESRFNPSKLVLALQARGIKVSNIYD